MYNSLYDIINRIVYDADQKRKKIITCEQFFVKLEENLKILGGNLSQEKMLDQLDMIEEQFLQDFSNLDMTPNEMQ